MVRIVLDGADSSAAAPIVRSVCLREFYWTESAHSSFIVRALHYHKVAWVGTSRRMHRTATTKKENYLKEVLNAIAFQEVCQVLGMGCKVFLLFGSLFIFAGVLIFMGFLHLFHGTSTSVSELDRMDYKVSVFFLIAEWIHCSKSLLIER